MEKIFHRSLKSSFVAFLTTCFLGAGTSLALAAVPVAEPMTATQPGNNSGEATDQIGLVRNWESSIPVTLGEAEGSTIKFVIPANSHPAFYLDRPQLDELLNNPKVSEQERNRFLGNLDVWVTLNTKDFKEVVSSRDRGVHGRVLGIEGALRLAEIRKELLTAQGQEVTEELRFIPRATVFAMSAGGSLQAMDAETGRMIWSQRLEKGRAPIQGYAVSDHTIAVVNGSTLELYDAITGTKLKEHPVSVLPYGPPAIAGNKILVGGANGRIELLLPFGSNSYRSAQGGFSGRLSMPMTSLNRSYVWAVDKAVYVSSRLNPARPLYRIPTTKPQEIAPVGVGNLMVLPLANGEVKCFTQTSGLSAWTTFIGEDVVQQPTIIQWPMAKAAAGEAAGSDEGMDSGQPAEDSDDPFGAAPASGDSPAADDPFGAPAAAADDDPFGSPAAAQEEDPFGASAPAEDDPFGSSSGGSDPFGGGSSDDPFGGVDDSPFSGGDFDSFDDDSESGSAGPGILRNQTVDMNKLLNPENEVRSLLVTESGNVIALDMRTGEIVNTFRAGNIKNILTVTSRYVYATSLDNQLVALDMKTGAVIGQMQLSSEWNGVVNSISDRVYLQSENGQILCLRPRNNLAPRYAYPPHLVKREVKLESDDPAASQNANAGGEEEFDIFGSDSSDNPFGGGDDPFK